MCCQYCKIWDATFGVVFDNFLLANGKSYINLDLDSEQPFDQVFQITFPIPIRITFLHPVFSSNIFELNEGAKKGAIKWEGIKVASSCIFSNNQPKCVNVCKISPEAGRGILSAVLSIQNVYLEIPQQCIIRGSSPHLFSEHVCSGKSTSWANKCTSA